MMLVMLVLLVLLVMLVLLVLLVLLVMLVLLGLQKADDGQSVVGAVRPQDVALLLLQRGNAADRLAPTAQL